MTLEVPNDLQYALLEFIAHINTEDYDAITNDFINLGFTPENVTAERLKNSGITEGLSFAFRQLSKGGGPKKIQERAKAEFQERYGADLSDEDLQKAARAEMMERMEAQLASEGVDVKGVTNVMEEMSRRNREPFQLPSYVWYVVRAFSTLEGIGLSIDENYAIVQECYPYLSRRLFVDRNPRAKKALRTMLGLEESGETEAKPPSSLGIVQAGAGSANRPRGLSPEKLLEMSEGFASYTAATADTDRDGKGQATAIAEFTRLFLDTKGSTIQDILVEESAKLGDAVTRSALRRALIENPAAKAAAIALRTQKDILKQNKAFYNALPGPLKEVLIENPAALPQLVEELLSLNSEDERMMSTARDLSDALRAQLLRSNGEIDVGGNKVQSAPASQLNDGVSAIPRSLPSVNSRIASVLSHKNTRKMITDQLPGVPTLGRRIGAGLLRRAAYRAEKSVVLPE